MDKWSLNVLYESYEDEKFKTDCEKLQLFLTELETMTENLSQSNPKETITNILKQLEQIVLTASPVMEFISLNQSVNTTDTETAVQMSLIEKQMSRMQKPEARIAKYIGSVENLQELIESDEFLKGYEHLLKENVRKAKYALSDEAEEVFGKMNLSGGSGWESMRDYLTSTLEVDYEGQKVTLSDIRNLAHDAKETVRKSAYEAELASYNKIKDAMSFSLNNIKQQVITECELRGYDSPLDYTLQQAGMKRETLEAMLSEMERFMPKFREYLKRKGEMLGHKNGLPFYDLFAPIGESNKKFTVEEAKIYLVEHFKEFSQDLADMITQAFDEQWIDFFPRKGKVGGAFCAELPTVKQSRILTNFNGSLSDVVTLAHELGHAYHNMHANVNRPLNWDYSMPVAETASTFNETLIMNAAIAQSEGSEKLSLIESQIQDITQIMVDIYSRYLFETEVFARRKNEFLFAETLDEIMLEAQKKTYGDGLDEKYYHSCMWVNKSHYYSPSLSFYNFPYAFGGLFARGLYAKYEKEGSDFVPVYQKMLRETTVLDVEDAAKIVGVDLTKPEFWRLGLESYAAQIDEFIRLSRL